MEGITNYLKDVRPWGEYERYTLNEQSTVKIITVRAGQSISLQTHKNRDEFWRIIKGSGIVRVGDTDHEAHESDTFFIPKHSKHRAQGGSEDLVFLEIAFGDFDENDIERIEDKYGRV
ncbi:MAG: phosphomannose isomerase type II C-terminal cupin domain [Candidatus Paceibacteria bacterium]